MRKEEGIQIKEDAIRERRAIRLAKEKEASAISKFMTWETTPNFIF